MQNHDAKNAKSKSEQDQKVNRESERANNNTQKTTSYVTVTFCLPHVPTCTVYSLILYRYTYDKCVCMRSNGTWSHRVTSNRCRVCGSFTLPKATQKGCRLFCFLDQ